MILTIQIVNYNSRENLKACLHSIEKNFSGGDNLQVIVVNNDKKKLDALTSSLNPELMEKNQNVGFGKAHNLGSQKARGEYILFLNPDTLLFPNAVERMLGAFSADEKTGIVGPLHAREEGSPQEECFGKRKTPLSIIGAKFCGGGKLSLSDSAFESDWVSGGAMMIKKDLFLRLGGFDEKYFMYFEDVDLCLRARKEGWKVLFQPKAKIFHKSGQSFSDNRQKKKYYYNSQAYYIRKNFGLIWEWAVKILRLPFFIRNVYFEK